MLMIMLVAGMQNMKYRIYKYYDIFSVENNYKTCDRTFTALLHIYLLERCYVVLFSLTL